MADVADARVQAQLNWLSTGLDWEALLPGAVGLADGLREYRALVDEVVELCGGPAAGEGTPGGDAASGAGTPQGGAMVAWLSALSPASPGILPDSGITVDRSTAERRLATSTTDPFSRTRTHTQRVHARDAPYGAPQHGAVVEDTRLHGAAGGEPQGGRRRGEEVVVMRRMSMFAWCPLNPRSCSRSSGRKQVARGWGGRHSAARTGCVAP
jgi:hypothetical protein